MFHVKHPPRGSYQDHPRNRRQPQPQLPAGGIELLEGQGLPGQLPGPGDGYLCGVLACVQGCHGDLVPQLPPQHQNAAPGMEIGQVPLLHGQALPAQLPQLAENLAPLFEKLKSRLLALAERLPDGLGTGLRAGVEEFFKTGAGFGTKLYETLFSWASGIIGRLPDAVLFAVTAILSSFMLSGELPAIRGWLRRTVRPAWLEKLQTLGGHVRTTLGGWLRAQLKLMGITFLILNAGLLLLRVRYPVLAALIITVVDALPVFGTGTILIPWALALFLQGETKTGVGLVILYGAAALSRQALEPRLVGKQVGLNPVLTLLALYTGYRLLGVGGMIVFPIAAMLFKQLWDHSGLQPDG